MIVEALVAGGLAMLGAYWYRHNQPTPTISFVRFYNNQAHDRLCLEIPLIGEDNRDADLEQNMYSLCQNPIFLSHMQDAGVQRIELTDNNHQPWLEYAVRDT
jgi:hypothetical protein